jgi:anti-anti-sigma factor
MERADEFAVTVSTVSEATTVAAVVGELDLATSPELERALEGVSTAERVVIDLRNCTFLDSSAIRVLVARARVSGEAGGGVAVVAPDPRVRRALEIAAIDRVVELHDSLDAALQG